MIEYDSESFNLKCPFYAFSDISFHLVCNISVCECKRPEKFQKSKYMTNFVCQKKEPILNGLKLIVSNSSL